MNFTCPVCYYALLSEPAAHYNICDCCGTEFGLDDERFTFEELRLAWIANGARWFFQTPPIGWNPWTQLLLANVSSLPYSTDFSFSGTVRTEVLEVTEDAYALAA